MPEERLRFWEPRHPKLVHLRHYSFHNRGYVICVYQIALWPREPILLIHTVQGLDWHKIIICQRDDLVSGNPKLGHIRHYSFNNRGYVTCVYQIAIWPREPILLVYTVQGLDCHLIIICQRDVFVSGNQGTPNLAIYATIHSLTQGM